MKCKINNKAVVFADYPAASWSSSCQLAIDNDVHADANLKTKDKSRIIL